MYLRYILLFVVMGLFNCSCARSRVPGVSTPNCVPSDPDCDPTEAHVLSGAVIYVIPRNNEIIPNGDYNYSYSIEFVVDRSTTVADLKPDISIIVPASGAAAQISATTIFQSHSYSGVYYTATFPF